MNERKLFEQAIADAKAIREASIANAKSLFNEEISPRIKEMIAQRLEEEEGAEEMEDTMEEADTAFKKKVGSKNALYKEEEEEDDDMEDVEGDDDDMGDFDDESEDDAEAMGDDADVDLELDADVEGADTQTVGDMTVAELTSLIQSAVETAMGGGEDFGGEDLGGEEDFGSDLDTGDDLGGIDDGEDEFDDEVSTDIDLQELAREIDSILAESTRRNTTKPVAKASSKSVPTETNELAKVKRQLAEAVNTINLMRKDLQDVNTLNAKLLYFNKILKNKNLSEGQVANLMVAFDNAKNVEEAKLVYETYEAALVRRAPKPKAKGPLNESFAGGSSKTIPSTSKKSNVIQEDPVFSRWNELAFGKNN